MKQQYFIVVVAHSLHGRIRRLHIPHSALYVVLAFALFGFFSLFGIASSYLRMVWKVANYNTLRSEVDSIRQRYQHLEKATNEKNQQLATLQLFASEVSMAYGLKRRLEGPPDIVSEGRLMPELHQSIAEYDFLKTTRIPRHQPTTVLFAKPRPALWPLAGRLLSHFGIRTDPFNGRGSFHTGVDIAAPSGTPIRVTADGSVSFVGVRSGYGWLVVVDHPDGVQTYYAHLSRPKVLTGQGVRMGDIVALSGASGRVTTPHLHYEVRVQGSPVNPYKYLQDSTYAFVSAGSE